LTQTGDSAQDPCPSAGEIVDLIGPLHTLISLTINGNNVSGKFHFEPQGISGLGETTGDKYQATGVTQETFKLLSRTVRKTSPSSTISELSGKVRETIS
jgi:hypothetical protein